MRTKISLVLSVFICIILSCQINTKKTNTINGVWESIGSGWILHIQDSTQYAIYDYTSISCLPKRQAELQEIEASLSLKNDTLSLKKGIMTYQFTRINSKPDLCSETLTKEKKNDNLFNFEVFAENVKDHYAFMDLNNLDWSTLYSRQKSRLEQNNTEVQLYQIIEETLETLNDNHRFLEATDDLYTLLDHTEINEPNEDSNDGLPEYGDFQIANMVAKHYLKEDLTKDSWLIKWGKMEDNIGYIQIKAMWLYADLDIPQSLIDELGFVDAYINTFYKMNEGHYIEKEVDGVRTILDKVMIDLMDTNSIIIDVRFNGGGQDAVGFEILKRFNDKKRRTVTTTLFHKNKHTPSLQLHLDSSSKPYKNPMIILTSQQTGSAAESFAISSMSLPQSRRIGARTQGALSTALEKTLPNSWIFSISNEIYMDAQGISYENIGVPVDIQLDYPKDRQDFFRSVANDLEADKQKVLMAIRSLNFE